MPFNPSTHYRNCVNLVSVMRRILQSPPVLVKLTAYWGALQELLTSIGAGATAALADIGRLGAARNYNGAYLALLQLAPALFREELIDLADDTATGREAATSLSYCRDYANLIRDPFNVGFGAIPTLFNIQAVEPAPAAVAAKLGAQLGRTVEPAELESLAQPGGAAFGYNGIAFAPGSRVAALASISTGETVVDTEVVGPVSIAVGPQNAYLAYQTLDGNVYVTLYDGASTLFPSKLTNATSGAGVLAMPATGPSLMFDPGSNSVLVAFQQDDGNAIVVASTDPALSGPWTVVTTIPTPFTIASGLTAAGSQFAGFQFVYFAITSGASAKFVYVTSNQEPASILVAGNPLDTNAVAGPQAALDPASDLIALSWADQAGNVYVSSAVDPSDFAAASCLSTIPGGVPSNLPAGVLSNNNALFAVINSGGQLYGSEQASAGGSWSSCAPLPMFSTNDAVSPFAIAQAGLHTLVARVNSQAQLQYVAASMTVPAA